MIYFKTIALVVFMFLQCALGQQIPQPLSTDHRITQVVYQPNNIVPIYGKPFISTHITFNADETIHNVQSGDLAAWTITVNQGMPHMLFIKPTVEQSDTNMIVVTNQHTYYFELHVIPSHHTTKATYAVTFTYPSKNTFSKRYTSKRTDQIITKKTALCWDYSFWGDRSIVPVRMHDDGEKTYLQLQPHQPIPAIFAVTNPKGDEENINITYQGRHLTIDRIAPQFILRHGKHHIASLFNNTLIKKQPSMKTKPRGALYEKSSRPR